MAGRGPHRRRAPSTLWCAYCGRPFTRAEPPFFRLEVEALPGRPRAEWHRGCLETDQLGRMVARYDERTTVMHGGPISRHPEAVVRRRVRSLIGWIDGRGPRRISRLVQARREAAQPGGA